MSLFVAAFALAIVTAIGHSVLSERLFLGPLRAEPLGGGSVLAAPVARRLTVAMFHLPSLCWVAMGFGLLWLDPALPGHRETALAYAGVYALSGLGNFWGVGRVHPGGVLLLTTSALIVAAVL